MTTLTAPNATGYIVHRADGSDIHNGYNSGTAKLYRGKGHATAAANRLNRWIVRRWNPATRIYEERPNTNPWVVSEASLVLKEDAVKVALRKYLTENTNVEAKAVDVVLSDLMGIIKSNA